MRASTILVAALSSFVGFSSAAPIASAGLGDTGSIIGSPLANVASADQGISDGNPAGNVGRPYNSKSCYA
jgi:hypothetical protein